MVMVAISYACSQFMPRNNTQYNNNFVFNLKAASMNAASNICPLWTIYLYTILDSQIPDSEN